MDIINQISSENTDELIITIPQFIEDYQFIDNFGNDNSPVINAENNNNIYECTSDNDILVLSHKMDCNLNDEKEILKQSYYVKDSKKINRILKNIRYQIKGLKKLKNK